MLGVQTVDGVQDLESIGKERKERHMLRPRGEMVEGLEKALLGSNRADTLSWESLVLM